MSGYRIVETDDYGGDYPDEKFVLGVLGKDQAEAIAEKINEVLCSEGFCYRFWKVVEHPYKLQPRFDYRPACAKRAPKEYAKNGSD